MKLRLLSIFSSVLGVALAQAVMGPAYGQSLDYGSLQDLFGGPVTVSATGTPQRASDVAANMTIITADQIRQSGVRDIPEIIGMYVPGIDVTEPTNGNFNVGVRGYQQGLQPRVQVLVDGRQIFVDDYSRVIWKNIPVNIDDIRQIEVVVGAASAMFGSNAAAGAINIVTYSPSYDHSRSASLTGGTQNTRSANTTVTAGGSWGGIKMSAGFQHASEFHGKLRPSDSLGDDTGEHYVTASSELVPSSVLRTNIEFTYSRGTESVGIPVGSIIPQTTNSLSLRGGFTWESPLGTLIGDAYANHDNVTIGVSPLITDLIVGRLDDRFSAGDHNTLRVGVEYRSKTLSTGGEIPALAPDAGYGRLSEDVFAVSASWLWQITDTLSWTNAARLDLQSMQQNGSLGGGQFYTNADYDRTTNAWSANSGLVYQSTPDGTLRLTYGRGIVLASELQSGIVDVLTTIPVGRGLIGAVDGVGNPYLSPTVVQNVEFDYSHRLRDLDSTISAAIFGGYNSSIMGSPQPVGLSRLDGNTLFILITPDNLGSSRSLGGEFDFKGQNTSGLRWELSYSYVHVHDSEGVRQGLDYAHSTPAHHIRLLGGYTTGPWEFDANVQYLSSRDTLRSNPDLTFGPVHSDGYITLGGRIAYSIGRDYTVDISATNLNHDTVLTTAYPRTERQVMATLTGRF